MKRIFLKELSEEQISSIVSEYENEVLEKFDKIVNNYPLNEERNFSTIRRMKKAMGSSLDKTVLNVYIDKNTKKTFGVGTNYDEPKTLFCLKTKRDITEEKIIEIKLYVENILFLKSNDLNINIIRKLDSIFHNLGYSSADGGFVKLIKTTYKKSSLSDKSLLVDSKKKLTVGDSINFKDGRTGIVEDYDDRYYYVRDNNSNLIKIKMKDDKQDYINRNRNKLQNMKNGEVIEIDNFGQIYKILKITNNEYAITNEESFYSSFCHPSEYERAEKSKYFSNKSTYLTKTVLETYKKRIENIIGPIMDVSIPDGNYRMLTKLTSKPYWTSTPYSSMNSGGYEHYGKSGTYRKNVFIGNGSSSHGNLGQVGYYKNAIAKELVIVFFKMEFSEKFLNSKLEELKSKSKEIIDIASVPGGKLYGIEEKSTIKYYLSPLEDKNIEPIATQTVNSSKGTIYAPHVESKYWKLDIEKKLIEQRIKEGGFYIYYGNGNDWLNGVKNLKELDFVAIGFGFKSSSEIIIINNQEKLDNIKNNSKGIYIMIMCLKSKLNEFDIVWNQDQEEVDKILCDKFYGK